MAFESAARSKPKGRTRSGSKRVLWRFGFVKSVAATISLDSTRSPNVSQSDTVFPRVPDRISLLFSFATCRVPSSAFSSSLVTRHSRHLFFLISPSRWLVSCPVVTQSREISVGRSRTASRARVALYIDVRDGPRSSETRSNRSGPRPDPSFDRSRTVGKISSLCRYLVDALASSRKSTGNGWGRTVAPEPQQPATHDPTDSLFSFPTTSHPFANPSQNPSSLLSPLSLSSSTPDLSSLLLSTPPLPIRLSPTLPAVAHLTSPHPSATLSNTTQPSSSRHPRTVLSLFSSPPAASPCHVLPRLSFPPIIAIPSYNPLFYSVLFLFLYTDTYAHTHILICDGAHGNGISSVSGNGPSLRAFRSSTFVVATNNSYLIFPSRN